MINAISNKLRKLRLFLVIVWRKWDEVDGRVIRLDVKTAWQVAEIVWPWKER